MTNIIQRIGSYMAQQYQRIENDLTTGSFIIKFYPFLMHPCVRNSYKNSVRFVALLSIFCGLYAFFAEFIVVLFSEAGGEAYISHTMIELLLPQPTFINERAAIHSPLAYTMQTIYFLHALLFILIYVIAVTAVTSHRFRLLGGIVASLFSVGAFFISSTQGGVFTVGGLQNIGFEISIILANVVMVLSGCAMYKTHSAFKKYSLLGGMLGILFLSIALLGESAYMPLLERAGIYLFWIWEILLGFYALKSVR